MKLIKNSSEDEMILEFLKGEYNSVRFNKKLVDVLDKLNLNSKIIEEGKLELDENNVRKEIMKLFRGYPDSELFNNFPRNITWKFVEFEEGDIDNIYYIDYDYWNLLSNNTSKVKEAAKTIKEGIEIYEVSNQPFIGGLEYIKSGKFPPVILLSCNDDKFLIIEGHSRMTVYGMDPDKFVGTYGFVGYCSKEEMEIYDSRMI